MHATDARRRSPSLAVILIVSTILLALVATPVDARNRGPAAMAPLVKTAPAKILVTAKGMTLYLFAADKKNMSACTGACAKYWPPLLVPAAMTVPTMTVGIGGEFGTSKRADGTRQLTYDGAPLYTFIKDKEPGDMYGEGASGVWWVAGASPEPEMQGGMMGGKLSLVKTAPAKILVTAKGMTLYLFAADKKNMSMCTGACAKYWPPLLVPAGMQAPANMTGMMGTFGVAKRADGTRQLTYDGAPLYTFIKDKEPGDMYGEGVGAIWWVVGA